MAEESSPINQPSPPSPERPPKTITCEECGCVMYASGDLKKVSDQRKDEKKRLAAYDKLLADQADAARQEEERRQHAEDERREHERQERERADRPGGRIVFQR